MRFTYAKFSFLFQTWGTLVFFLMAMVLHPECQHKAQAQIDAVCGGDIRLLTFEDRESLPYIGYIMWEVLRYVFGIRQDGRL